MRKIFYAWLLISLLASTAFAQMVTEVIPLRNRLAVEKIPVIKPR